MNKINEINLRTELNYLLNMKSQKKIHNNKSILVLCGGGVKLFYILGALSVLNDNNYLKNIKTVAATSIGTVIGLLYICGYSITEIFDIFYNLDFESLKNIKFSNLLEYYGLDDGSEYNIFIQNLLIKKNIDTNITFKELYDKTNIKFITTVCCVNDKTAIYYNYESHPDMKIIDAIRQSCSIPIYMTPVRIDNKYYIDGGCIDNYPINLFKDQLDNVIGINLQTIYDYETIDDIESYLKNIIYVFNSYIIPDNNDQTIKIKCENYSPVGNLTSQDKTNMFNCGVQTALEYI